MNVFPSQPIHGLLTVWLICCHTTRVLNNIVNLMSELYRSIKIPLTYFHEHHRSCPVHNEQKKLYLINAWSCTLLDAQTENTTSCFYLKVENTAFNFLDQDKIFCTHHVSCAHR